MCDANQNLIFFTCNGCRVVAKYVAELRHMTSKNTFTGHCWANGEKQNGRVSGLGESVGMGQATD